MAGKGQTVAGSGVIVPRVVGATLDGNLRPGTDLSSVLPGFGRQKLVVTTEQDCRGGSVSVRRIQIVRLVSQAAEIILANA